MVKAMMPTEGSIVALSNKGIVYCGTINVEEGGEATLDNTNTLSNLIEVSED
jgi:hypothetical protein